MKTILLATSFLYFYYYAQSQKNPSVFIAQLKTKAIEFKIQKEQENLLFDFSGFKIIDKRFDTTAIGYLRIAKKVVENCKLVTKQGLSADLESFLNNTYKTNFTANKYTMVIILRKFWFYRNYNFSNATDFEADEIISYFFRIKLDYFLYADDTFTPLIRKDTTIEIPKNSRNPGEGFMMGNTLQTILNNLSVLNVATSFANKRRMTIKEINEHYDKYFTLAILDELQLKKGVYMNFDEFKKNSPSHSNFDVKKTKLTDDIYLVEGKDSIPTRKAWGYCDGKNLFIKAGWNLFELTKQDNSFSFMGNKKLTHRVNGSGNYSYNSNSSTAQNLGAAGLGRLLFPRDKFKIDLIPMLVDMETGEAY